MALGNEELNAREVATLRAQVPSVEKIDDLTVPSRSTRPTRVSSSKTSACAPSALFLIMPEHVWSAAENPATFTFNPPIGTGPYTFTSRRRTARSGTARQLVGRRDGLHGHARARARGVPGIGR
jgi:peptide/nickel transport system substrate-binding protein